MVSGIGVGMVTISALVCVYFNVILAWVSFFIIMSFSRVLPWSTCTNSWNSDHCVSGSEALFG